MLPLPVFVQLLAIAAIGAGTVIRRDVDEVESNKGRVGIVDGDIVLTDEQRDEVNRTGERTKRQITKVWKKWPNARVYFFYDNDFSELKRQLVATAMSYISAHSCITFEESSSAENRIKFMNTGGCASYIGMNGGEQPLWFGDGCTIFGTAVHEIMHSLGIFHTHSRYDRDNYLIVNLTGVPENMLGNLDKETTQSTYNAVPFEYGSTMQYRYNTWGEGTLFPKQEIYQKTMGIRRVSFYDMANVNSRYSCRCSKELSCKNGGYTNPANCEQCICPSGFGGALCDGTPPDAIPLTAEPYWKGYWVNFGYSHQVLTTNFYMANLLIKAPEDKTIQVKIVDMTNFTCAYGCNYNGIEIKYMGDPRIMNPIICCKSDNDVINKEITAKLNPLPIIMHQRYGNSRVTINYRYLDKPLSSNQKTTNGYDSYEYYA